MSLRDDSKYSFGLVFARFLPLNDDLTIPLLVATEASGSGVLVGGAGPTFDFSGIDSSDDAIPLIAKIDNGGEDSQLVDLSGAVDISAVTRTELLNALTAAGITDATFALQATTNRIQCTFSSGTYQQLYGECAEVALFGQGLGVKFVKTDTLISLGDTPIVKDEETFTTTDASGLDTEVISDGYRKGFSASIVDSAEDFNLRELIEGGQVDDDGAYEVPTSADQKIYFMVEAFYTQYEEGTNKEADLSGYIKKFHRSCKGGIGERSHEREFADMTYEMKGTAYKDASDVLWGDTKLTPLTIEEYEALDVENV